MAMTRTALAIFVASFSHPAVEAVKFLTASSDELPASDPIKKLHKRKSEYREKLAKMKVPKVSEEFQSCFTTLKLGVSPGSTLGQTTEASVDACMSRCIALDDCYAMSFRMSDGLCNAMNRTYEVRFEASDERVLANKLSGCNHDYGTGNGMKAAAKASLQKTKAKLPEVSLEAQQCFSNLVFGASPGSTLGQTTETSVDDCMMRCAYLEDCHAMSFRMSDGLCNAVNRTYEARFEASDERVLANKLAGCFEAYGTPKGTKAKQQIKEKEEEDVTSDDGASSGIMHKIGKVLGYPFTLVSSIFSYMFGSGGAPEMAKAPEEAE